MTQAQAKQYSLSLIPHIHFLILIAIIQQGHQVVFAPIHFISKSISSISNFPTISFSRVGYRSCI